MADPFPGGVGRPVAPQETRGWLVAAAARLFNRVAARPGLSKVLGEPAV